MEVLVVVEVVGIAQVELVVAAAGCRVARRPGGVPDMAVLSR